MTSICRFVQAVTALSITQSFFARMPLLSLWLLAFLFVWISSFASATLSTLCFSMSSRQPSSLSGPSPRISTAGAYCVSLFLHPSALVVLRYEPLMVLVEGEGFEPPMCALRSIIYYNVGRQIITRCFRPLSQPSLLRLLRENSILTTVKDSSSPSSCHTPHWQCSWQSRILGMPSACSSAHHSCPSS